MQNERYYLTSDEDGHWFVVPLDSKNIWENYLEEIYKRCNYGISLPDGVMKVGRSPSLVTFENPIIR